VKPSETCDRLPPLTFSALRRYLCAASPSVYFRNLASNPTRAVKTLANSPFNFQKYEPVPPAPANAVDAGGSPRECGQRYQRDTPILLAMAVAEARASAG
jgi:hypothetical protein